jgi:multiple sugar transport system permease protein
VDKTTTMLYYIYQSAFQYFEMGYASAIAFTLFLMLLVFSVLQLRLYRQNA